MIVIIAGMQRSGSTFSYNVARELLEKRGGVSAFPTNSLEDALSAPVNTMHTIIKTHAPDDLINSLLKKDGLPCLCTVRKPEDAIASWIHVFGFTLQESVATYRHWLIWHQSMSKHMLNLRYEEIDRFPFLAIQKITRYLVRDWGIAENMGIWWRNRKSAVYVKTEQIQKEDEVMVDIGFSYYDSRTFFHRKHVSSLISRPATELLSKDQVCFIRDGLREFLDKNGNYDW